MNEIQERFWLVWNPAGQGPPRHRHQTEESARIEAERLARYHRNETFFVLAAVESVKVSDLQRTKYA